jgi:hypothetical protein
MFSKKMSTPFKKDHCLEFSLKIAEQDDGPLPVMHVVRNVAGVDDRKRKARSSTQFF